MKKNLLFAVIAGIAVMTGCSKNEVLDNTSAGVQDKIEFTPIVGKQTRASEILSADLQKNGTVLSLYGYNTSTVFASRNTGTFAKFFDLAPEPLKFNGYWSTAKDYEWTALNAGYLSIFTYYSPKNVLTGITAPSQSAAAKFTYTVPNVITDQEDLLVAAHLDMNKVNTGGIIAINFKHALSQLYFRAKLTGTGYKAVIKSIKVLQAVNSGTFTYTADAAIPSVGTWSATTGKINYIYADALAQEITSKDNPERIAPQNGSLMLMPQAISSGVFQFEVTYDVFDSNGNLIGSKIVKTADMAALEMGKKYVYTLVLPASENDKIAFDVTVSAWDDTSVATEREVRFDDYNLAGSNDATAIRDLITGYTPSVIYIQEVKVAGAELTASMTIALDGLSVTAVPGSKIILDCAIFDWGTNNITVTAPTGWTVGSTNNLSADGKITVTKN